MSSSVMRTKMRSRSTMTTTTPDARRIDTKLEAFLAQELGGPDLVDFYDQDSCVQDDHDKKLMGKFTFKVLIVCRDGFYICDNPPKNLNSFVHFQDVVEITTVDDVAKFLKGVERENATHIRIKCSLNPKKEERQRQMVELKQRMLELKRSMVYSRAIDNKLSEIELSTPRTYQSMCSAYMENNGLDLTHRSNATLDHLAALNTNRSPKDEPHTTHRSVRFDPELDEQNEAGKIDAVTQLAVKARYSHLVEIVNKNKAVNQNVSVEPLSLSLPLTPRSLNGVALDTTNLGPEISQNSARELESIENQINFEFIKGSQNQETTIHVYVLNPKTRIFQTLRNAHFLSKINSTLTFHQTVEEEAKLELMQRSVKLKNFEKKFQRMKIQIQESLGDLERLSDLFDELLCASHTHHIIKKMFWNSPELYRLIINEISRFLPKSPARMDMNIVSFDRRIKELECSIVMIEVITAMFSETEFYDIRNEILQEEKCRYLGYLFDSLIGEPELPKLDDYLFDDRRYFLHQKMKSLVSDLTIVTGVLLWEILHFVSLSWWISNDFNLNQCVKSLETMTFIKSFIPRLIDELSKMFNDNTQVVLTPKQTVIAFKLFWFLATVIEKSTLTSNTIKFLRSNHSEEFKYYFNQDRVKLKTFNYYPITSDLIQVVRKLSSYVVEKNNF